MVQSVNNKLMGQWLHYTLMALWSLMMDAETRCAAVQASITESDAAQLLPQRWGPAAPHALCPPLPCNQSPGWLAPYCKTPGLNCVTTAQCLRLTAQLCCRACEMQPLRVAVLGSVQRGDLCSDHPSSLCCRTPTEDVPSVSSSSKWTKSRLSGSQRVKMFVFQMAPEVLTPQSTATVRRPMQWANIVSPPGPAAMATEGATGGRDGGAFGTVSDVCLFTPTAKGGNRSSTTAAASSRMLRNTRPDANQESLNSTNIASQ